jgi:hypothetical protein
VRQGERRDEKQVEREERGRCRAGLRYREVEPKEQHERRDGEGSGVPREPDEGGSRPPRLQSIGALPVEQDEPGDVPGGVLQAEVETDGEHGGHEREVQSQYYRLRDVYLPHPATPALLRAPVAGGEYPYGEEGEGQTSEEAE